MNEFNVGDLVIIDKAHWAMQSYKEKPEVFRIRMIYSDGKLAVISTSRDAKFGLNPLRVTKL
jgi:hypothetical protein